MAGGPGGVKGGGGVDVEFFPPDTRNLTQRSLRSERMENGGIFNWGRDCSRKGRKGRKGGGRESAIFNVGFFPADTRNLTQRSLRSERMENGGIFNWGRGCSRPEVLGHAPAWILD